MLPITSPDAGSGLSTRLGEPELDQATTDVELWTLTARERTIYEMGFMMGYFTRQPEINQANDDADRYYRAAYDRGEKRYPHRRYSS